MDKPASEMTLDEIKQMDSARDRLLAFLAKGPIITEEEGEAIMRVVREMREASIGDPLPS